VVDPVVSVVVLAYNHASFLDRALESIMMQDFDSPYEVLVAVDASTDQTVAVARELAARTSQVAVLTTDTNLGMQRNLRRAIEATRGPYVAFLEGDDYWTDARKLRLQHDYLESHAHASAVGHLTEVVPFEGDAAVTPPSRFGRDLEGRSAVGLDGVLGGTIPHFSSLMYRAEFLPTTPSWFDDLQAADWPICGLLAQRGEIGLLQEPMSVYRKNPDSMWAPRPQLERLLLLLDDRMTFQAHLGRVSAQDRRQLAEAHVRIASVALSAREPATFVHHVISSLRLHPATVARWVAGAIAARVRRIRSAHARRS
jgi:glycosyltransferase involved in cell wall biosynthesis